MRISSVLATGLAGLVNLMTEIRVQQLSVNSSRLMDMKSYTSNSGLYAPVVSSRHNLALVFMVYCGVDRPLR